MNGKLTNPLELWAKYRTYRKTRAWWRGYTDELMRSNIAERTRRRRPTPEPTNAGE